MDAIPCQAGNGIFPAVQMGRVLNAYLFPRDISDPSESLLGKIVTSRNEKSQLTGLFSSHSDL